MTKSASIPVKAGETPVNVVPMVSYQDVTNAAATRIEAMMKGGVSAVTFIASGLLVGYLHSQAPGAGKVKLDVIRDEFALLLKKKGLGGTQTKAYIDMGMALAREMHKECKFGMEVAALIAATTADKAHNAVEAWLKRHTHGKKTEHGFSLTASMERLNVLAVFLKKADDPAKPETLGDNPAKEKEKAEKARKALADRINKDTSVLGAVSADKLVEAVTSGTVISFAKVVTAHCAKITKADELAAELKEITKAYHDRIKALSADMGKAKAKPARAKKSSPSKVSAEAAAA